MARRTPPIPTVDVWFAEDNVYAYDFPANTLLTLTIQDDQGDVVYTTTGTTNTSPANAHLGAVGLGLSGVQDIVAGGDSNRLRWRVHQNHRSRTSNPYRRKPRRRPDHRHG